MDSGGRMGVPQALQEKALRALRAAARRVGDPRAHHSKGDPYEILSGVPKDPHPLGLHRSLDPPGVLPQTARRLDATPRALENEIAVSVRALSIDSASFRQLRETESATGEAIGDQIFRIVRERGKMQNPVTGSGGMLLGEVAEVGASHPDAARLPRGTRIATLVSLTLTPLHLEAIGEIHVGTERVEARGTAILFARTLYADLVGRPDAAPSHERQPR